MANSRASSSVLVATGLALFQTAGTGAGPDFFGTHAGFFKTSISSIFTLPTKIPCFFKQGIFGRGAGIRTLNEGFGSRL